MGAIKINKQYTSFGDKIDEMQYNIAGLFSQNDTIIKLLTDPRSDCLGREVTEEQRALAFDQNAKECRVFFTPYEPKTEEVTTAQLRIYVPKIKPESLYTADIYLMIDIMVDITINRLDRGQRWFRLMSEIMNTLNGQQVGTIGSLDFLKEPLSLLCFKDNIWGYSVPYQTKVGAV